jgi:hypothetical protein
MTLPRRVRNIENPGMVGPQGTRPGGTIRVEAGVFLAGMAAPSPRSPHRRLPADLFRKHLAASRLADADMVALHGLRTLRAAPELALHRCFGPDSAGGIGRGSRHAGYAVAVLP